MHGFGKDADKGDGENNARNEHLVVHDQWFRHQVFLRKA
jgi:hypothetical protein